MRIKQLTVFLVAMSAPCESSSLTTLWCPFAAAKCKQSKPSCRVKTKANIDYAVIRLWQKNSQHQSPSNHLFKTNAE